MQNSVPFADEDWDKLQSSIYDKFFKITSAISKTNNIKYWSYYQPFKQSLYYTSKYTKRFFERDCCKVLTFIQVMCPEK